MKTSGSIYKEYIYTVLLCVRYGSLYNINRLISRTHWKYRYSNLFTVYFQLFDSSRSVDITCCKETFTSLILKLSCKLSNCCCLTGTLETTHHDDRNLIGWKHLKLGHLASHKRSHFVTNDLDNHLSGIETLHNLFTDCLLGYRIDEIFNNLKVNIGFKKSSLNFLHCLLNIIFLKDALASKLFKYILQFIT